MRSIHMPVPLYEEKIGDTVKHFMNRLKVSKPVWRANWAIVDDPTLFQPLNEARTQISLSFAVYWWFSQGVISGWCCLLIPHPSHSLWAPSWGCYSSHKLDIQNKDHFFSSSECMSIRDVGNWCGFFGLTTMMLCFCHNRRTYMLPWMGKWGRAMTLLCIVETWVLDSLHAANVKRCYDSPGDPTS